MKKILLVIVLLAMPSLAFAGPAIDFSETRFDFGDVEAGRQLKHDFSFRNAGDAELVIKALKPS